MNEHELLIELLRIQVETHYQILQSQMDSQKTFTEGLLWVCLLFMMLFIIWACLQPLLDRRKESLAERARAQGRSLYERAARMIDSAEIHQDRVVERWLSLMNREIHAGIDRSKGAWVWGAAGGGYALEKRFRQKFGRSFSPRAGAVLKTKQPTKGTR